MRLRFRTEDPSSIWHAVADLGISNDVSAVRQSIVTYCRTFFGAQFYRYSKIHISLHHGTEVLASFAVVPAELDDGAVQGGVTGDERQSAA
ncbi:MAG: hypothetical protein AB7F75_11140 [Planctomycetota bacterium]